VADQSLFEQLVENARLMSDAPYKPSVEARQTLEALERAVTRELERKRRLGHYVMFWIDGKIVYEGEDAPEQNDEHTAIDPS